MMGPCKEGRCAVAGRSVRGVSGGGWVPHVPVWMGSCSGNDPDAYCVFRVCFLMVLAVSGIGLCVVRRVAHTAFLEVPPCCPLSLHWGPGRVGMALHSVLLGCECSLCPVLSGSQAWR